MTQDDASLRAAAHDTIEKLAAFRDDVKVRIHLAGMEVKDIWKEAEPAVTRVETRLKKALDVVVPGGAEQVRLELTLGLAEAKDHVHALEPKLHAFGDAITDAGRTAIAKLKQNLASLDSPGSTAA
jgi:hypothetical protein